MSFGKEAASLPTKAVLKGEAAWTVIALIVFLASAVGGWILLPNSSRGTYALNDGDFIVWTTTSIAQWSWPTDLSPQNFLAGLGSLYYPALPWLNPGAMALLVPGSLELKYILSYFIYSVEIIAAIALFVRHLGGRWSCGAAAGILYCFFLVPPFSNYFMPMPNMSLAPLNAHLTSLMLLMVISFENLGKTTALKSLGWFAVLVLSGAVALYSSMFGFLSYAPTIIVLCASAFVTVRSPREVIWKVAPAILVAVFAILVLHLNRFLQDGAEVTARSAIFGSQSGPSILSYLQQVFQQLKSYNMCTTNSSMTLLFPCGEHKTDYINALGPLCGLGLAISATGRIRLHGITVVVLAVLSYVLAALFHGSLLGRVGVVLLPTFFVFTLYAFYTAAIALFVWHLGAMVAAWLAANERGARLKRSLVGRTVVMPVLAAFCIYMVANVVCIGLVAGTTHTVVPNMQRALKFRADYPLKPATRNEIIAILEDEAGLKSGKPFGGVVVTQVAARGGQMRRDLGIDEQKYSPAVMDAARFYFAAWYGNSFMWMDLWSYNIPTVQEYGQWVTGAMKVFTDGIFSSPGDSSHPSYVDVYNLRFNAMRAMGIRFIISDDELQDPCLKLRAEVRRPPNSTMIEPYSAHYAGIASVKGPVPVRLYEVCDANVGSFSPLSVRRVDRFADAVKAMKAPEFDGKAEAVVFDNVDGPLVAATNTFYTIDRGASHFKATAAGKALVVLPLQFSRCLKLHDIAGKSRQAPQLIRTDGVLTGIVFDTEVDATISFDFGLGSESSCRGEDGREYRELRILG